MNLAALELHIRESEWLNAWAFTRGADDRQAELEKAGHVLSQKSPEFLKKKAADNLNLSPEAISKEITADALAFLTEQIRVEHTSADHDEGSVALLALNPLGWDRTDVIQVSGDPLELIDPEAPDWAPISQFIVDDQGRPARLYEVHAPAYGYRAYRTRKGLPGRLIENPLQAEQRRIESNELRITFDEHGETDSVYDKVARREIAVPGSALNQIVTGNAETWIPLHNILDWQVTESGPLRATIEIVRSLGQSKITQQISLWRHVRRVDFRTSIELHDNQTDLRILFPINLHEAQPVYEARFTLSDRPVRWLGLSQMDYQVALLNNGVGTYQIRDNIIIGELIKVVNPRRLDADRAGDNFTYSLFLHNGTWQEARITHRAYELNVPLRSVRFRPSESRSNKLTLPPVYSFVHVDSPDSLISRVKMAEDHDGLFIRVTDPYVTGKSTFIHFAEPVGRAILKNVLFESVEEEIPVIDEHILQIVPISRGMMYVYFRKRN